MDITPYRSTSPASLSKAAEGVTATFAQAGKQITAPFTAAVSQQVTASFVHITAPIAKHTDAIVKQAIGTAFRDVTPRLSVHVPKSLIVVPHTSLALGVQQVLHDFMAGVVATAASDVSRQYRAALAQMSSPWLVALRAARTRQRLERRECAPHLRRPPTTPYESPRCRHLPPRRRMR